MLGLGTKGNIRKVAVLLTLLGKETAQEILKQLEAKTVEKIGKAMLTCTAVSKSESEAVLREFVGELQKIDTVAEGGPQFVQEVIGGIMGADQAQRLVAGETEAPIELFGKLKESAPERLPAALQNEHPQAIALVIANLPSESGALIMNALSEIKQIEVAKRLAVLDQTVPDLATVQEIEQRMLSRLAQEQNKARVGRVGGIQACASVLNLMEKNAVKNILTSLEGKNQQLALEIKARMVRFEDIVKLDGLEVQRVLKEIETQDLGLALQKAPQEVETKVFQNMSVRGAEMLKEDMEVLRNIKPEAVRAARQKVAETMRRLDEEGTILLNKGNFNEQLV